MHISSRHFETNLLTGVSEGLIAQLEYFNINLVMAGQEPAVQLIRFWPDHFLPGAHPLLVNACD